MALLMMIIRRMSKNKWLAFSMLCGLVFAVATVAAVPVYTQAILTRMLIQDMKGMQLANGTYPGIYYAAANMGRTSFWSQGDYLPEDRPAAIRDFSHFIENEAGPGFGIPVQRSVKEIATEHYRIVPEDPSKVDARPDRIVRFAARSELYEHIRLVDGLLPASRTMDGFYEVLVTEKSLRDLNMVVGSEFRLAAENRSRKPIKIRVSGVIDKADHADPYWNGDLSGYRNVFLLDPELFEQDFTNGGALPPASISHLLILDYTKMGLSNVNLFLRNAERIESYLFSKFSNYETNAPALAVLNRYLAREASLRYLLWGLNVPVFLMLAWYLTMIASMSVERQKTEISVIRSRGGSRMQIFTTYFIEGTLLGLLALAVGIPASLLFTHVLGASNGFLEFVDRAALRVQLAGDAWRFAIVAAVVSGAMTLLPALRATNMSIVRRKQQSARAPRPALWQKYYLDIALVATSLYGIYSYDKQSGLWSMLGADAAEKVVDPMFFVVPALFLLGCGMLLMRMYPLIVTLVYRAGRRVWPAPVYTSLLQVSRAGNQYQFVMIFLMMTVATGLYSASAARTLHQNVGDMIRYSNGADLVLQQSWAYDGARYAEPPFDGFKALPGVEQAAKVFVKESARFRSGQASGGTKLMGIHTADFGRAVTMREDLLPYSMTAYLNLIAPNPQAVLVSRSIADFGVNVGDTIHIGWDGVDARGFTVYGVVDYWPSFHPLPSPENEKPALVIGHLDYIQMALAIEPYQVWMKLREHAGRQPIFDVLADKRMNFNGLWDTEDEIRRARNDPFQLAVNGAMTLGFLVTATICFVGFMIFWMLSMSGRTLQFGIYRAMGISFRQLIVMLVVEQLLTSVAAVSMGGILGGLASRIFVRMFQLSFDPAVQAIPFLTAWEEADVFRLYSIIAAMLMIGLLIIARRLEKIKIHQAIKLGED